MISELMPRGYDNMFFALFGITNRAVSINILNWASCTNRTVFDHRAECHSGNHQQLSQ